MLFSKLKIRKYYVNNNMCLQFVCTVLPLCIVIEQNMRYSRIVLLVDFNIYITNGILYKCFPWIDIKNILH